MAGVQPSKRWIVAPPWDGCDRMSARLGVAPMLAQALHNRGLEDVDEARRFLDPQLSDLCPPEALSGAGAAADLLARAVRDGKRIVLYGDYDVDGMTGIAILWHCLRLAGARCDFYVPHRLEEGYGVNDEAIERLAADGTDLIVTIDCGITARDQVRRARELGVDVIVTDHHAPPDELPEASAIVHPQLDGYANPNLAGAGVAMKLAWALAQRMTPSFAGKVSDEYREFLLDATCLAALGTIADVVPLVGENRVLARYGLLGLRHCKLPGIRALIETTGLKGERLDTYHVGFVLAPRLNAIGRMGHARLAVELLTRADDMRAQEIAIYLDQQNRQRQSLERKLLAEARQMVADARLDDLNHRAIVLAREGWHAGVIGIVASRLVDEFHRPAVLIALGQDGGQGSARSVRHFHMHDALCHCAEHLMTYGGHAMAAGLRIQSESVGAFAEAFVAHANATLTAVDLQPGVRLDGEVSLDALTEAVVNDLNRLGPFGSGNARPKWATPMVELIGEPRVVGKRGEHLQLTVRQGQTVRKGIAFGQAGHEQALRDHRRCSLAFEPIINEFNGQRSVELQVVDFQWPR
ncbi:MAG: single-stranded-DNA-specific exonuclease RecJ [Phycisphaerae bacterium]|nr:single-stranded-DNA-specific exonuclease RecJ [Phycisphaerae bacterium]